MTRLYLIRHGQTDWNIQGRWQGHADIPLNAHGLMQARQIASALAGEGLGAIYASDLSRARETADALAKTTGLGVHLDERLREIHQGEWQGLSVSEIRERYQDAYERRKNDPAGFAPPGGETVVQLRNRLVEAVAEIRSRHPAQRVALVSHGFAVAVLSTHFMELPLQKAWEMIPDNDEWQILDLASVPLQGPAEVQN
jgi:probable phosphoglycerate mutase